MMRHLLLLLFIFAGLELSAEKIDGPANIRRSPQGEKFISLNDRVDVTCTVMSNNWYQIGFNVKLTKEQYEQDKITIPAGTKLYNLKNELIGEALVDLIFSSKMTGGPQNKRWYATEFVGYTYKINIRLASIPELELIKILNQEKESFTIVDFMDFLDSLDFENYGILRHLDDRYDEYMIYESWIDDPSPIDRIRLIFNDIQLTAVIHSREIDVKKYSSYELTRGLKILIIDNMDDKQRDDFIELNRKSYIGVD